MEDLALEACGVSKRYGHHEALCGVNLVARRGQLHGLLGPNGAGKTTLLRILLGLVRRDAGRIRVLGRDLSPDARLISDDVAGFVEPPAFYPYLSGRTNLALLARLDRHDDADRGNRVDSVLEHVGLHAQANAAVATYSAGMRQRLGLAAALLRSPRLLLLDEPTSSLDPGGSRDVRALARRLADAGAAVVLSSHDMAEVEELCTELTVINRGRVVFTGSVGEFRTLAPPAQSSLQTSDDGAALALAAERRGVKVAAATTGGLTVAADIDALDAYVIALGRAGIAVRTLEHRTRSFESLFLELTGHDGAGAAPLEPRDRPSAAAL